MVKVSLYPFGCRDARIVVLDVIIQNYEIIMAELKKQ